MLHGSVNVSQGSLTLGRLYSDRSGCVCSGGGEGPRQEEKAAAILANAVLTWVGPVGASGLGGAAFEPSTPVAAGKWFCSGVIVVCVQAWGSPRGHAGVGVCVDAV